MTRAQRRCFWREFFSGDNSRVNTMAVVAIFLAAPFALLSWAALLYHIFWLKKGLDSPAVQLFSVMVGAATGGLGLSMFSRTIMGGWGGQGQEPDGPKKRLRPPPPGS